MSKIIIETPKGEIETDVNMNLPELKRLRNLLLTAENYRLHGKNISQELIETIRESEADFMSPVNAAIKSLMKCDGFDSGFISTAFLISRNREHIEMHGVIGCKKPNDN